MQKKNAQNCQIWIWTRGSGC